MAQAVASSHDRITRGFKEAIPNKVVLFLILGFVVSFPAWVSDLQADRFSLAVIYAVIGLSVNILMGYSGQISLGHQAFVGVGAFSAAYLSSASGLPLYLSIPAAGAIGGVIAIMLGIIALRLQGLYLALITLAYGALAERSIFGIQALTGGGAGRSALRPDPFTSDRAYAYLCMLVLAFLLFLDWRMLRTKFGRALLALKSNEQVAASFGMNPVFYKVAAFVLTGIVAGIGGGLYAFKEQHVVSADFTFALALTFVIMTVIGGLGNRVGVVIGSAFTAYLPFLLGNLGEKVTEWTGSEPAGEAIVVGRIAITAILLMFTITTHPGGIAQQLHPLTEWLSGKPFPKRHHRAKVTTADIGEVGPDASIGAGSVGEPAAAERVEG